MSLVHSITTLSDSPIKSSSEAYKMAQPASETANNGPSASELAPPPSSSSDGPENAGPSKSELKRRAKEAEKAQKAAERAAREAEEKKKREAAAGVDLASQNYGKLPLHQSQERPGGLVAAPELRCRPDMAEVCQRNEGHGGAACHFPRKNAQFEATE